jgi:hypothetical protein
LNGAAQSWSCAAEEKEMNESRIINIFILTG